MDQRRQLPNTPETLFRQLIDDDKQSGYVSNFLYLDPNQYHDETESELKAEERKCFEIRIAVFPEKENLKKAAHAIADVVYNTAQPFAVKFKCLSANAKTAKAQGWFGTSRDIVYGFKDRDGRGKEICITLSRKRDLSGYNFDAVSLKNFLLTCWKRLIDKKVKGLGYIFPILDDLPFPTEFGLTTPFSYTCYSLLHPQYGRLRRSTESFSIERDLDAQIKITLQDLERAGISLEDVNAVILSRLTSVHHHQVSIAQALISELTNIKATCEGQPAHFILRNELNLKLINLQARNFPKDQTLEFLYELQTRFLHNEDHQLSLHPQLEAAVRLFNQLTNDDIQSFINYVNRFLDDVFANLSRAKQVLLQLYDFETVRLIFSEGDLDKKVNGHVEELMHKAAYSASYSLQLIHRRLIILEAEKKVLNSFAKDEATAKKLLLELKADIQQRGLWKYPVGIKTIMLHIDNAEHEKLGWCLAAFMVQLECRKRLGIPKFFRNEQTLAFYQQHQNLLQRFSEERAHFEREVAAEVAEFLAMPNDAPKVLTIEEQDPGERKSVPPPNP